MENLDFNIEHWQDKKCPPINCKKKTCKCGLEKVFLPAALGDDSKDSPIAPRNGAYCNVIVVYEANGHIYIYSKEGIPTLMTSGGGGDYDEIIKEIEEDLVNLQDEIDAIKNSPDVVDIVPTYAALQAYDTSKLGDNDIVRVLADEQHDGASTYYRWNKQSSTWTYIGEVGDYYTKGQVDNLLDDKQDTLTAGANITIDANNEISATDTTYTQFTGATASTDGTQGLVPGPLAGDEDKFLKADGTWATAGGGPTVVQTTGTSTTDVMSQNATTSMVFADPLNKTKIQIGSGSYVDSFGNYGIAIGSNARATDDSTTAVGYNATSNAPKASAFGRGATANHSFSVALGAGATTSAVGEINVSTGSTYTTSGYNGTNYRLISGVYDGQNAHDAVTVSQVNSVIDAINTALSTSIPHIGA